MDSIPGLQIMLNKEFAGLETTWVFSSTGNSIISNHTTSFPQALKGTSFWAGSILSSSPKCPSFSISEPGLEMCLNCTIYPESMCYQWAAVGFVSPKKKSCPKNRVSMCILGHVVFTFLPGDIWDKPAANWAPCGVTFRVVAPRKQEPWWGGAPRGQLTLKLSTQCLFAKSSYRIWILFGIGFWLRSHLVSQLQISSSVNLKFT